MKNEEIIAREQFELAKAGSIRMIEGMPEPIHTFQAWKELGYKVKKGEHAVAKFPIWKYAKKEADSEEEEKSKMFLKISAFFSAAQVELM